MAISDGQARFPAYPAYAPNPDQADVRDALRGHGLAEHDYLLNATALVAGDLVAQVRAVTHGRGADAAFNVANAGEAYERIAAAVFADGSCWSRGRR